MEPWKEELYHHGILGQKWGVRRFQNSDGTLTALGKKRYSSFLPDREPSRPSWKGTTNAFERMKRQRGINPGVSRPGSLRPKNKSEKKQLTDEEKAKRKETAKKIAKGVAIGAGVAAAAGYGAYRIHKNTAAKNHEFNKQVGEKLFDQYVRDNREFLDSLPGNWLKDDKKKQEYLDFNKKQKAMADEIDAIKSSTKKLNYKELADKYPSLKSVIGQKELTNNNKTASPIKPNTRTIDMNINDIVALARGKSTPSLDRKINKMAEEIKNDTTSNITKGTLASMRNDTKKNIAKSLGTDESLKKAVNSLDDDTMALLKKYNFPTPGLSSTNGSKKVSDVSKSLGDLDSYTQDLLKRQRRGTASLGKAVKLADMTMDDLRKLDLW